MALYFKILAEKSLNSEIAAALQDRLLRTQNKLFTFLKHDGIPWNNNNAENAIKKFAYYRERVQKLMGQKGLSDYLVLLSICETCRYKGISFLRFMLSGLKDVDLFSERLRHGQKGETKPQLYPKGFIPPSLAPLRKRFGRRLDQNDKGS